MHDGGATASSSGPCPASFDDCPSDVPLLSLQHVPVQGKRDQKTIRNKRSPSRPVGCRALDAGFPPKSLGLGLLGLAAATLSAQPAAVHGAQAPTAGRSVSSTD